MIRICFFNLNAYSLFNPKSEALIAGTEIQLFNTANYLSFDDEFKVFFVVGDWKQGSIENYGKILVYKSISLEKRVLNYIKAPFLIWRILKKINAHFYVASSAGIEIGLLALFCKINNKNFIYRTAHDIDCSGEYSRRGIAGKIYNFGIKNASAVVTQTEKNQKMLKENYQIKAIIVRNAYEINISNKPEKDGSILWVSRCAKWKNPRIFLKIAKNFPKHSFVMICNKQKDQEKFFLEIKKDADKINNLDFIEKVPFLKIQKFFNKASLFLGTSEYEGFPNTYLQACLGKAPIVSYKVNPDEFITKKNLGYCADGDFKKMVNYIKKLLDDRNDWEEKSKNAYEYVRQNHDIKNISKQWKDIIHRLVKN